MTGTYRGAMSPLDFWVHLLVPVGDDRSPAALSARCGLLLPMSVTPHDQLPPAMRALPSDPPSGRHRP